MSKRTNNPLTQADLKALFDYDPGTGLFTWVKIPAQRGACKCRAQAGHRNKLGYRYLHIRGAYYTEHRLAFLYMLGRFPENEVDHINRIRDDNRWENLRAADRNTNMQNCNPRKNACGFPGIYLAKATGLFRARITAGGVRHELGGFATAAEAFATYCRAKAALHGGASTAVGSPYLTGAQ